MGNAGMRAPEATPSKKTAGRLLALLVLVLLAPWSHGQTASATQAAQGTQVVQKPAEPAASVSTNADEVSLDLVVHDKKNKLVLDLKPGDLAVTDNDAPVTLSNLHLVNGNSTSGHLITMVFDHLEGPAAKNAQDIANKILRMAPRSGFSFAVLSVGSRLRMIQSYTEDRQALGHALDVATGEGEVQQGLVIAVAEKNLIAEAQTGVDASGKMVNVKDRAIARALAAALEGSQRIVQDQHTRPALAGLLALARSQQQIVERKTIIYFTLGAQVDSTAKDMMHTIVGAANRAGVSIYTIDMNGLGSGARDQLMTMSAMGAIAGRNPIGTPGQGQPGDPAGPGAGTFIANNTTRFEGDGIGNENNSPIAQLATGTGGIYIDGQDSVKKPLERMFQDMTVYYEATYVPPIEDYDGKFRAIGIKPLRVGLAVRSKTGYFALPPGGGEGIRPFEAPLLKALSGSPLPSDLKFNASILRLGDLPDGYTNSLVVEVPVSELQIKKDTHTNLYSAHVSIVAQIKDKNGTVIEHFSEDIPRHGALDAAEKAKSEAITMQRHFIAPPGEYVLEAAVMDRFSGDAAAERVSFDVPEAPAGPALSDMILVRRINTFSADADSMEPLRYENGKVTPNLSGQVTHDAKTVSLFFILHPDPKVSEPPTLEMEVLRDGRPAGHTPLPYHPGNGAGPIPYMATLQTSALAPGFYDVTAQLMQGGKKVQSTIGFTVEGNQPLIAGNAAPEGDTKLQMPGIDSHAAGQLEITVPDKAVPPPSAEELKSIIEDARKRAVSYAEGLPNFMCVEVTNRSVDPTGEGRWKHRDTVMELLVYRDKTETRSTLEVDGKPVNVDRESMKGQFSSGEFGGVLNAVFDPAAKADFQWKETDALGTGTVQVFSYRVAKENASFKVTGSDKSTGANGVQITVGFHGQAFIDSATRSVRRVTLEADDIPRDFSVRSTAMAVDYDYVVINAHDYLMPITAEVSLKQGRREAVLNEMEFRDYKRFGSNMKILGYKPVDKP
jgi:VWFA-related protein